MSRAIRLILLVSVISVGFACGKSPEKINEDAVNFSDYPAEEVFDGTHGKPVFAKKPDAREVRDKLESVVGNEPNFAGRYSVVTWGCGTFCESSAVVDAKTGLVYWGPPSEVGFEFEKDSRLLVTNPKLNLETALAMDSTGPAAGFETGYYLWEDNGFRRVGADGKAEASEATEDEITEYKYHFAGAYGGVYRSIDGGQEWELCGLENFGIDDLLMLDNGLLFAGSKWELGEFEPEGPGGVFRSNDFGDSWVRVSPKTDYGISANDLEVIGNEVYLAASDGLYRSTNFGDSWEGTEFGGGYSREVMSISANEKRILVAASNSVFSSEDKGRSWRRVGDELQSIRSVLLKGKQIVAGTFSGLHILDPKTGSWISKESKPILSLASRNPGPVLAGSQGDGIARSVDDGKTWKWLEVKPPDLFVSAFLFEVGRVLAGTAQGLYESRDLGNTWKKTGFDKNVTALCVGETKTADFEFLASLKSAGADVPGMTLGPSTWIRLTKHEGRWVIFEYCFAGTPTVTVTEREGEKQIDVFYGQDGEGYRVLETSPVENGVTFTVENIYFDSAVKKITFRYQDESRKFGVWEELFHGNTRFVNADFKSEIPVVQEEEGDCGEP